MISLNEIKRQKLGSERRIRLVTLMVRQPKKNDAHVRNSCEAGETIPEYI